MAYVFGYGSLVNCNTHGYRAISTCRLAGWRRQWCHWIDRPDRRAVSLTIVPMRGGFVDGIIALPATEQWGELDEREAGYSRVSVRDAIGECKPVTAGVVTYQSQSHKEGSADYPIFQSYLDTVLEGFFQQFGEAGVDGFIETTDGWATPILRDRAAPRYPRACSLTDEQAARFDRALEKKRVRYLEIEAFE